MDDSSIAYYRDGYFTVWIHEKTLILLVIFVQSRRNGTAISSSLREPHRHNAIALNAEPCS